MSGWAIPRYCSTSVSGINRNHCPACVGIRTPPPTSLRTLILDGASLKVIRAFIRSEKWKDQTRLKTIQKCTDLWDVIEPLSKILAHRAPLRKLMTKLASQIPESKRRVLDLL